MRRIRNWPFTIRRSCRYKRPVLSDPMLSAGPQPTVAPLIVEILIVVVLTLLNGALAMSELAVVSVAARRGSRSWRRRATRAPMSP